MYVNKSACKSKLKQDETNMADRNGIESVKSKIYSLPLVDVTVVKLLSLLNDPDSSFQQIVEDISPEIAARFIQMANSAYYWVNARSIEYAVRVLGFSKMKQVITTSMLMDHFSRTSDLHGFDFQEFRDGAQLCATISRAFGRMFDHEDPGELFTAAMLLDIGELVIAFHFKDESRAINDLIASEGISADEAERRVMGLGHPEIAALILERYHLSQDICDAVRFHEVANRQIPKNSNYKLELIVNKSAKMTDSLEAVEKAEYLAVTDRLEKTVVKEGQRRFRKRVRGDTQQDEYQNLFVTVLEEASILIYDNLVGLRMKEE